MMALARCLLVVLAVSACSSAEPAPVEAVPDEAPALATSAIGPKLDALGALLDALEAGDAAADGAIEDEVRRLTRELASSAYDDVPLSAGRLRARLIFVALGEVPERRLALEESRRLLAALLRSRAAS